MKINKKKCNYIAKTKDILSGFKIASPDDTIEKIIKDECSITRFGDGEFDMIVRSGNEISKI